MKEKNKLTFPLTVFSSGSGGTSLPGEKLQECISRATTRQKEIQKLIDKVINSVKTAK